MRSPCARNSTAAPSNWRTPTSCRGKPDHRPRARRPHRHDGKSRAFRRPRHAGNQRARLYQVARQTPAGDRWFAARRRRFHAVSGGKLATTLKAHVQNLGLPAQKAVVSTIDLAFDTTKVLPENATAKPTAPNAPPPPHLPFYDRLQAHVARERRGHRVRRLPRGQRQTRAVHRSGQRETRLGRDQSRPEQGQRRCDLCDPRGFCGLAKTAARRRSEHRAAPT